MQYKNALIATLCLLLFWHGLSILLAQPFLPTPYESFAAFFRLSLDWSMPQAFFISLFRVVVSSVLALLLALPMGIAMGRIESVNNFFSPFVAVLYPLPKVVFLPIFVVLMGLGNLPKIILIALIVYFQILVVVRDAAKAIPRESLLSMRSLSQSPFDMLRHLIWPWILPDLLTALRVSVGTAIAVLFFAETFASFDGLGHLILDGMEKRDYPAMYAGIIGMSLLGVLLYQCFAILEKRCCKWKRHVA